MLKERKFFFKKNLVPKKVFFLHFSPRPEAEEGSTESDQTARPTQLRYGRCSLPLCSPQPRFNASLRLLLIFTSLRTEIQKLLGIASPKVPDAPSQLTMTRNSTADYCVKYLVITVMEITAGEKETFLPKAGKIMNISIQKFAKLFVQQLCSF